MIDPFFFDRLMHAFTTTNSTPLTQAAAHAIPGRCVDRADGQTTTCRALQEAEAVVAEVMHRERTANAATNRSDHSDRNG